MSNRKKGKSGTGRKLLIILAGLLSIATVAVFFLINQADQRDQRFAQEIAAIKANVLQIPTEAAKASSGAASVGLGEEGDAFENLQAIASETGKKLSSLRSQMAATGEFSSSELASVERAWEGVNGNITSLVENRESVDMVAEFMESFELDLPDIQDNLVNVVDSLVGSNAPTGQILAAQEQLWLIERAGRSANKMLVGGYGFESAADTFRIDVNKYMVTQNSLLNGDFAMGITKVSNTEARKYLEAAANLTTTLGNSVEPLYDARNSLIQARQASTALVDQIPVMIRELDGLLTDLNALPAQRIPNNDHLIILIGVLVVFGVMIAIASQRKSSRDLANSKAEAEKNNEAIVRLLDEISDLADGDLTVEATVTEDFTGTIADSINFAIGELRTLVGRVMGTSEAVTSAAANTRSTSLRLAERAELQAQEIAGASAAINEMAITIDQVSSNSSESAAVAERSVSIAKRGAQVVRDTIQGMDTIREQIQDTSKRIKRLGESSQEIGDIVSLINEIADQTNILALNAAIQAAMAGEAGRGFAVVADEVQRLAERSASATKEIASLVKTIQTDTIEAVSSMEQTTAEVVKGADLANNAGIALGEIENVSAHLAELIQDISEAAKHQATTSAHISNTMNVIQEITSQTLAGTNETAQSIGNLAELADGMRDSVAGFKVSEFDSVISKPIAAAPIAVASAAAMAASVDSDDEAVDAEDGSAGLDDEALEMAAEVDEAVDLAADESDLTDEFDREERVEEPAAPVAETVAEEDDIAEWDGFSMAEESSDDAAEETADYAEPPQLQAVSDNDFSFDFESDLKLEDDADKPSDEEDLAGLDDFEAEIDAILDERERSRG